MSGPVVLVTGASGLIGSNMVDGLLAHGYSVVGLARRFPLAEAGLAQFAHPAYTPVSGDVGDSGLLDALLARHRPRYLVHLAGQAIIGLASRSAQSTFEVNVRGAWCVLEAARRYGGLDAILVASSERAYGEQEVLPFREELELRALNPYDVSKRIIEEIAASYFHISGLPITVTRCANVFGPCDLNLSRIVPGTILSCLRGEDVMLRSRGLHQRCYVYVRDVVDACLALMTAPAAVTAGQAFNIGNDRPLSALDMASRICRVMGRDTAGIRIGDDHEPGMPVRALDCRKIRTALGWGERYSLDAALEETVAWYTAVSRRYPAVLPGRGMA